MAPKVAYLDWLERSVAASVADGALGELVVVRAFFALSEDHGELTRGAGAAVAMAGRLFGQPLAMLHAEGSAEAGQISVHASFGGRTAMLSAELVRPGERPEVRLLILGEKGSLNHDDEPGADGLPVDLTPPEAARETALVERSLRTGGPVEA